MKLNVINAFIVICTTAALVVGCNSAPKPTYDVSQPIQVTVDLLKQTRHFHIESDYSPTLKEQVLKQHPVTLIKSNDWEQLFLKTTLTPENNYRLSQNLSRTCWAIKADAELKILSQAHRGADFDNTITACVSKRLGNSYPLFLYSVVNDKMLGSYVMMLSPINHYSEQAYLCKAKKEGYDLPSNLYCE